MMVVLVDKSCDRFSCVFVFSSGALSATASSLGLEFQVCYNIIWPG